MARGKSGRIVLEIEQNIKNDLYIALAKNQTTLKDWFLDTASCYIKENSFSNELLIAEKTKKYSTNKNK